MDVDTEVEGSLCIALETFESSIGSSEQNISVGKCQV